MTKLWNNGQRCKNVTCDKKSKWIGINWPGSMNTLKGKGRKASLITNKGKTSIRYATIKQDYHCRPFRSKARKPTFYISSWTSEHETHACRKSFQDLKFQSSSRRFFAFGVSGSGEFPNEVTSENKRCKVWIRAKLRLQKSKPWEWDGGMRKKKKINMGNVRTLIFGFFKSTWFGVFGKMEDSYSRSWFTWQSVNSSLR